MLVPAGGSRCAREGARSREREPSSESDFARGGREPSSEAGLARGGALLGRSGGPRGSSRRGLCCVPMFCVMFEVCLGFVFLQVLSRIPPWFFRGPSWLSPTVAPEHLWAYQSGSPRCWSLLIGHSSLPVANAFLWGRVSGPAGLAPEALQERECSCRAFFAEFYQQAWYMSQPASAMLQPASVTHAQLISFAFGASQEA
jgi:hypothetical protein